MEEKEKGLFEGLLVGKNRTRTSHLQFADNTIFYLELTWKSCNPLS